MGINVDGWVLTEPAPKVYAEGREQKVALLIGNDSQEMQPRGALGDIRAADFANVTAPLRIVRWRRTE